MFPDRRTAEEREQAKARMRAPAVELLGKLRGGGLPSHIAALEQLSYLLLIFYLDLVHGLSGGPRTLRQIIDEAPARLHARMRGELFPGLVKTPPVGGDAFATAMRDAVFAIADPTLLRVVLVTIADWIGHPLDCADVLDAALDEVSATSPVASPRTPRAVSDCMLSLIDLRPGDLVLDPAAGAGDRLLAVALDPGHRMHRAATVGFDLDATMVRIGSMSMLFHGVETFRIETANLLAQAREPQPADVVLCQPPFGNRIDRALLAPEYREVPGARSEVLFALLALDLLRPGGRAAMILPKNVAFSRSTATRHLRRRLLERGLRSVITLPAGTFRPHTNVETILVSVGSPAGHGVAFVDADPDREELGADSLPLERAGRIAADLLAGEIAGDESSSSPFRGFIVDAETITAHDHSLLSTTYRSADRAPVQFERPLELLTQIEQLEEEVQEHLSHLRVHLTADRGADA